VKPDVDVWSLGCVFSEAAVWASFGWRRVLEYRSRRQEEIRDRLDLEGEKLFHDGDEVLRSVEAIHTNIRQSAQIKDHITTEFLRLVDDKMLLNETDPRASAKQVYHWSKRIIKTARKPSLVLASHASMRVNEYNGGTPATEQRPRTPPCVPPDYDGRSVPSSSFPATTPLRSPRRPTSSTNSRRPFSQTLHSPTSSHTYHSRATNGNRQNAHNNKSFGPFCSDTSSLHDLPDPPSPTVSHSSHTEKFTTRSIDAQDQTYSRGHRARPRISIGEVSSGADTDKRRSRAEKKSSDHPRQSVDYDSGSVSEAPSPFRDPKPPSPPPSSSSNKHRPMLSPDASSHGKPLPTDQVLPEEPKRPYLTLPEGLLWKQRKKGGYLLPLSGAENFACLNQRDHVGYGCSKH